MGKSTINGQFSIAMLNYQRVNAKVTKVDKSLDFKVTSSVASCGTPSGAWHGRCMAQRMAQRMALYCADGDQQEGCKPNSFNMFYHESHSWLFPCGAGSSFGTLFLQVLNFSGVCSYAHLVKLVFSKMHLTYNRTKWSRTGPPQATSDPKSDWEILQ